MVAVFAVATGGVPLSLHLAPRIKPPSAGLSLSSRLIASARAQGRLHKEILPGELYQERGRDIPEALAMFAPSHIPYIAAMEDVPGK